MEGGSKIDRPDLNVEKEEVTNGAKYTSPVDKRSGESDLISNNNHKVSLGSLVLGPPLGKTIVSLGSPVLRPPLGET